MELIMDDIELVNLYMRFAKLKKRIVLLQAELDNVRELIKQKGI
jgi:hypothetical protein